MNQIIRWMIRNGKLSKILILIGLGTLIYIALEIMFAAWPLSYGWQLYILSMTSFGIIFISSHILNVFFYDQYEGIFECEKDMGQLDEESLKRHEENYKLIAEAEALLIDIQKYKPKLQGNENNGQ